MIFICYAALLHIHMVLLHLNFKIHYIMTKKKNQNRKQQIANKNAVVSLRFQTHYGLKVKGYEEGDLFQQLADIELDFISELGLTQDILDKRYNVCHPDAYPLYY